MTESVQGPEVETEPLPADETAPAGTTSWRSAFETMFGLAVIWACFYLVALAQQVSDTKPPSAQPAPAADVSGTATGPATIVPAGKP